MEKTDKSLQSIKVAASQTLKTRVVKSKKKYVRNEKHKAGRYSDEHHPLFYLRAIPSGSITMRLHKQNPYGFSISLKKSYFAINSY